MSATTTDSRSKIGPADAGSLSYWMQSKRPLEILLFLAPLIVAYEIGLVGVLQAGDGMVLTNLAHRSIIDLFHSLGISMAGLALPGIVLIVLLLSWQLLRRASWRVRPSTIGIMWIESMVLVLPLLLMAQLLTGMRESIVAVLDPPAQSASLIARVAVGVGAGLYEELIFRWLLIAVVHTIACDLFKAKHLTGLVIGIVLSAVAFTIYHPREGAPVGRIVFYLLGGAYFAVLFVARGFGIVAVTHALYNVVVVMGDNA